MFNDELFNMSSDNIICLNKYKVTVMVYSDFDKTSGESHIRYFKNDEELEGFQTRYIAKHQLIDIINIEELDNSEFTWMEGIQLNAFPSSQELKKIFDFGSVAAYEASLNENIASMILENDYRLSKLELGITGLFGGN